MVLKHREGRVRQIMLFISYFPFMKNNKKNLQSSFEEKKNDYFVIKATDSFKSRRMVPFTVLRMLLRSITRTTAHLHWRGSGPQPYKARQDMNDNSVQSVTSFPSICSARKTPPTIQK